MRFRSINILAALLLSSLLLAGCGPAQGEVETEAAALEDIETWRAERFAALKEPDSWLTLAGLYWLDEGENTFGSDPSNDVVFPDEAPPRLGTFHRADSTVRVDIAPGLDVRYDGEPVASIKLDPGGETASVILEWESLSWFLIKRDHGLGIRLKDSRSPALAAFDGVESFSADLSWRLRGRFEPYDPPKTIYVPTVLDTEDEYTVPGAMVFDVAGQTHRLDVTGEPADSAFFVIFADKTNGRETYGGGRYLWVDAPDDNGAMLIDFNKSYNPPCVFTPYATCPLSPRQNRLPIRIEAGEKNYGKGVL